MTTFIPFQAKIRHPIPTIRASKEFRDFAELLERMDEILIQSEIEQGALSNIWRWLSETVTMTTRSL